MLKGLHAIVLHPFYALYTNELYPYLPFPKDLLFGDLPRSLQSSPPPSHHYFMSIYFVVPSLAPLLFTPPSPSN